MWLVSYLTIHQKAQSLHYARPLVDDLEESWEKGIWYTRTALRPKGLTTHSAIIAHVMDLQAARHVSQLGSISCNHHCSVCQCHGKDTLGSTDWEKWLDRDNLILRQQAEQWKRASTVKEQDEIFDQYGTRWSEFWRLRYYNPTRQVVVDCMHNKLEGNAQHHFREVLGLTTASAKSNPPPPPAFSHKFTTIDVDDGGPFPDEMTEKEAKQVGQLHRLLMASLENVDQVTDLEDPVLLQSSLTQLSGRLAARNTKPLIFVCRDLKLEPELPPNIRIRKNHWVTVLVSWVSFVVRYKCSN